MFEIRNRIREKQLHTNGGKATLINKIEIKSIKIKDYSVIKGSVYKENITIISQLLSYYLSASYLPLYILFCDFRTRALEIAFLICQFAPC